MLPRLSLLGFGHKTGEGQCGQGEASLRARGSKAGGSRGGGKGSAETKMKEMQMETRSEQAEVNQVVSCFLQQQESAELGGHPATCWRCPLLALSCGRLSRPPENYWVGQKFIWFFSQ